MDENNIDSSTSHDVLHLSSSSEHEFKPLSAENYNNISVAQSSNKDLINDCHGREVVVTPDENNHQAEPTMAMLASSNNNAREELELTFEYEGQKYRADSNNCRDQDFQIASSISGHFSILSQHPTQNLRFDLISAAEEHSSLVSVSEVPVSVSESEPTVSGVLEDISVLQMKEGSEESNFPNTVFNCACCSTLASYPGITEFCVNTLTRVPISNSNNTELHSLENPPLIVTVVNALNLIFEYPALFSSKLDGRSTSTSATTSKSIFTTNNDESHLDNFDDKDFPLCSKCGLSIQQLYLTYKEFTSLLESEGRIIKAINEKLASCNSIQNYKYTNEDDDPHEGTLSDCHSSPNNNSSRNNIDVQPVARVIEEPPKEIFKKSIPNQKNKRGKKNNLRIARTRTIGGKSKNQERDLENQNQSSQQQSESQQFLILSLNDKEQRNLILENTENVKKVDAKVIKSKSQLPFGKRGPGRPKGPNRPKNVKQLTKNRLNPKSKVKPSPSSVSCFKKHISSSAAARKKKSSATSVTTISNQGDDFMPAISRDPDGQKDNNRSVVAVYATKSGYLAGEYNADGFITKSEDLFLENECLEETVSQRGRRRKPKALFSSEMKIKMEGKKSPAITTGALPQTPTRKRRKNTSIVCDSESGNLTLTMLTSTSPTTAKRIRNWKKESWIEKAQSDPSRTCDLCGKAFIFPAVMRRHKKIVHQGLKPYECSSCGKRFTQKVILNKHTCDFNKESGNRREFLQMTRESELRKFACSVCGHKFKYQTHLNLHEMNHRDERPYPCSQCDKTFRRPDHLKYHVRIVHVEEKKFICIKCGLCFKSISSLRAHEKKHGSEQGHLCNICGKSIKSMYQMSRHQKTHQDELPFVCPVCHKKFKMKDYLGQHLRRGKTCSKKLPEEKEKLLQQQQQCKIENSSNLNSLSHQQQPLSSTASSILGVPSIHDVNSSDLATGTRSMNSHPTEIEIVNREIGSSSTNTTTALNNIIIITTTRTVNNSSSLLEHGEHPKNDEFSCLSETPSNSEHNNYGSGPNEDGSVSIVIDEKLLTQL